MPNKPRCVNIVWGLTALLIAGPLGSLRAAESLPNKVTLIPNFEKLNLTPVAQGNRDVCSLFAITALAEYESDQHTPGPHERLSEEYLIWAGHQVSGKKVEQAMFYEAIAALNGLGLCSAEAMPYAKHPDSKRQPSPAAIANSQTLRERWRAEWIKRWSLDRKLTDQELTEIKQSLADGHPVACGLRWPKELKGYELLAVPPADQVFDGHSIVLVGYEDNPTTKGGIFRFRNSYGADWGEKGYGVTSYAYVRAYANDAVSLRFESPQSEAPTARFEAESMPIVERNKCEVNPQKMNSFGGKLWSGDEQLFCGAKEGGSVELAFDVSKAGRYRVRVLATAAPDFGIVRAALDGKMLAPEIDLYSGRVCPAGALELGNHELAAGKHRLRFTAVGKEPKSQGFNFGLDAVDLIATK